MWSALGKEKRPRNPIHRLKIPNSNPPQYERHSRKMAELARDHHDALQNEDIDPNMSREEYDRMLGEILNEIPESQRLEDPERTRMSWKISEEQVSNALRHTKDGTATGLDGCPYELWKTLEKRHNSLRHKNIPSFDVIKMITYLLQDIQEHGVDDRTGFTTGWMCPIFKKKDPTDIRNYRPITLLNTDYKLLTKVLALQLLDHISQLVHPDQAGYIPNRSIFDHIRLAKAILNYAEVTEEDGAILALDQEKAYDKIRHDYLWKTLEAFHLPEPFIQTVRALYSNAHTKVAINGVFSGTFKVRRGVRQGDPLSCPLFDLAIEPLACRIRADPNIKGILIPGIENAIKITLFADDTNLFLNKDDRLDYIQGILDNWCKASGARFNIEKTEIIPIGKEPHRRTVVETRKINPQDANPLPPKIRIARDGEAVRILGAWIGNDANDQTPWEPILDSITSKLNLWERAHLTLNGKRIIIQAIIGGHTQFLAKAQGMPTRIETALTNIMSKFIWDHGTKPRIAMDALRRPIHEGGLNVLNIKARNEAIEIIWLKAYLNFSPSRQKWATVTDHIILAAAPTHSVEKARENPFLQTWTVPLKGPRAKHLNDDIKRMLRMARKHKVNLAAIKMTPHLSAQLPAWYHLSAEQRPITTAMAKCLLEKHNIAKVADLVKTSARLRHPAQHQTHRRNRNCTCQDCTNDRVLGCNNPHKCATEALTRLDLIPPRHNPTRQDPPDGLSLTRTRRQRNDWARQNDGEITFDPSMTCKESLAECFRIFTNPNGISTNLARRYRHHGPTPRCEELKVYTDGACINNGKKNARCGSGVWFGQDDPRNRALRIPGEAQSNQIGEIAAVIAAMEIVPPYQPVKIYTDSKYVIEGLTTNLETWENDGWIDIKNARLFRKAAHLIRHRSAKTTMQWVKGHDGDQGNEGSDALAKQGANKRNPDPLNLEIPPDFDVQGAKLPTLTQATAYKGILERQQHEPRRTSTRNLQLTRMTIKRVTGEVETNAAIWRSMRKQVIRPIIQQFLYKSMHGTQMIGKYWRNINGYEDRETCATCNETESMSHILTQCREQNTQVVWQLAKNLWPHRNIPWPEITLGTILGSGCITLQPDRRGRNNRRRHRKACQGPTRLLQIIVSESAYLIWVLRCERVIQDKALHEGEIRARWHRAINERLTIDKVTATKIKRTHQFTKLIEETWEPALRKITELPANWIQCREVLVS